MRISSIMQQLQQYYDTLTDWLSQEPENRNMSLFNNQDDLSLIQLSRSLYQISLLNQQLQEINFTPELLKGLNPSQKSNLLKEIINLHKDVTHFIVKNKDLNAS